MQISAKTHYACQALTSLTLHWPNEKPLQIEKISLQDNIPLKFLTQILLGLKQLGYVKSVRGKFGGYNLITEPSKINLYDVIHYFEKIQLKSEHVKSSLMDVIWTELEQHLIEKLKKTNFEMIANKKRAQDNTVIFQI